jgi:hypothetical protein
LVETADAHPSAGIVVPALTAAGNERTIRTAPGDDVVVLPPFSAPPSAVIYLMPRDLVGEIEGWGEEYLVASGEDVDIAFKVWVNGLDIVYDERVLVAHVGKGSASKLDNWQALWAKNRGLFLTKWAGDGEVPRIATCDVGQFERNRAIAASVAEWMAKYFKARDKPPTVRSVLKRSPFEERLIRVRSRAIAVQGQAKRKATTQAGRNVRRLKRRLPPPAMRSARTVLVHLPPQVEDSLRRAARRTS